MTTPADTVFNKAADHNRAESERIERETKARKAENDAEIVRLLTRAIALGFSMHTPGAIEAVRTAFHDCFATETEAAEAVDTYALGSNDDIEIDDHPLMSTGPARLQHLLARGRAGRGRG